MQCTLSVVLLLKIIIATAIHVEALPSYLYPCAGSDIITVSPEKLVGNGNQYTLYVKTYLPPKTNITIKFDSKTKLINSSGVVSRLPITKESYIFNFLTISAVTHFSITVQSIVTGNVPYLKSVLINLQEYCNNPLVENFEDFIQDNNDKGAVRVKRERKKKKKEKKKAEQLEESCGRRQHLDYTELIVNGATSKPGDWPWHAALYIRKKEKVTYICGGTLIKKTFVLTAAHCVTRNKVPVKPANFRVVLGKYSIIEGDAHCQERNVTTVIAHGEFGRPEYLDNDIALLELGTEVLYDEFVQPACIWYKKAKHKLPTDEIFGTFLDGCHCHNWTKLKRNHTESTSFQIKKESLKSVCSVKSSEVAGWGYDSLRSLSPQLRQITMPKIKKSDCVMKNPLFYGIMLKNEKKFCAGWGNGTSPCNGDSGGGFMVFVPDVAEDKSSTSGAWFIRGIVSLAVSFKDQSMCDPNEYVIFTNILKYKDWIKDNTDSR